MMKNLILFFLIFVSSIPTYSQTKTDIDRLSQQLSQNVIREAHNIVNREIKRHALSTPDYTSMYLYTFDNQTFYITKSKCESCVNNIYKDIENYVSDYMESYFKKAGLDIASNDVIFNEIYRQYADKYKFECNQVRNPNYDANNNQEPTNTISENNNVINKKSFVNAIPNEEQKKIPVGNNQKVSKNDISKLRPLTIDTSSTITLSISSIEQNDCTTIDSISNVKNKTNGIHIDPEWVSKGTTQEVAIAPDLDNLRWKMEKDHQYSQLSREMERVAQEILQMRRFIKAFPSHGEYKEREKDLEEELKRLQTRIKKINKEKYDVEIKKQEEVLADYEKKMSECNNLLCKNAMKQGIGIVKENIDKITANFNAENKLTDNFLANYREPVMSGADKREEIEKERLKIIDKKERELVEKRKRGEITEEDFDREAGFLQGERAFAYAVIAEAKAERKTIDMYHKITTAGKEVIGTVKDMVTGKYDNDPNVRKAQVHVVGNIYGIASAFTPDGPSQFLAMLQEGANASANNENISGSGLVEKTARNYAIDKAIDKAEQKFFSSAPVVSRPLKIKNAVESGYDLPKNMVKLYDEVNYIRRLKKAEEEY